MKTKSSKLTNIVFLTTTICITGLLTVSCANIPPQATASNTVDTQPTNLVRGKIVTADTKQPIAGATVFVPKPLPASQQHKPQAITDLSLNSAIEKSMGCKVPTEPYSSFACTDRFGNFIIPLTSANLGNVQLNFQYNKTTVHTGLTLNDLDTDVGTILFADEKKQPEKEKIAIVLNIPAEASPMGSSIGKTLPLATQVEFQQKFVKMYDIDESQYDVEFKAFPDLFTDQDADHNVDIFKYKIVYLITTGDEDLSDLGKDRKATLLEYISNGGEFYVTTLSVEADESSLDDYI